MTRQLGNDNETLRGAGWLRALSLGLALALSPLLCSTANAAPDAAAPGSDASRQLQQILQDHWRWWLSENPFEATSLGDRDYDDQVPDPSLEAADRRATAAQRFLGRLDAMPDAQLGTGEAIDKAVLSWTLTRTINANRFGQRTMLFTSYDNWPQSFANLANSLPFFTRRDYDSYLNRLSQYPRFNSQAIAVVTSGLSQGYVQPCSALDGVSRAFGGPVEGKPEDTPFFKPFARARPSDVSEQDWSALKVRAITLIGDTLRPEYRRSVTWFKKDYLPKCRKSDSASALRGGTQWYAEQVKAHTTTDLTPAQIHEVGLAEIQRITARMDSLARKEGFPSRREFLQKLKADPASVARTPEELLSAAAWQAKQIDGLMPRYFKTLARNPYGIRAIPAETAEGTTTAYYMPGSPESGVSGTYYVNTSKLDRRPLWELPALTAHEAVPGHHHQISRQQELSLPQFRKYAVNFTAYTEGWGLYSEYLGEEMGLYDTPAKMMGRLSYEAWRAARLVVDTGIHANGWDKARAIAFMQSNTGLTDANIEAEVNRYISWPGQALGYKLGEIRLRELRTGAQGELGDAFDLREFHDAVLASGPVPLDILSDQIESWIVQRKADTAGKPATKAVR